MKKKVKHIYGPVFSWRIGRSLGLDILGGKKKICNFDCNYCQLGNKPSFAFKRKVFVPFSGIMNEIRSLGKLDVDYLTFSGCGEPTLAKNLGQAIKELKKKTKNKIAVITNSTLLSKKEIRNSLAKADFVLVKLDAASQEALKAVNRPAKGITLKNILGGIMQFRKEFKGKFGLQIMFVEKNRDEYKNIAKLASKIMPDEIQINTPLRQSAVKPLSKKEMTKITEYFKNLPALKNTKIISVYDAHKKKTKPINVKETVKRRGAEN